VCWAPEYLPSTLFTLCAHVLGVRRVVSTHLNLMIATGLCTFRLLHRSCISILVVTCRSRSTPLLLLVCTMTYRRTIGDTNFSILICLDLLWLWKTPKSLEKLNTFANPKDTVSLYLTTAIQTHLYTYLSKFWVTQHFQLSFK
jgi:hypothetical protein